MVDEIEELLPLVRKEEYLIIKQIITEKKTDIDQLVQSYDLSKASLLHARNLLEKKKILNNTEITLMNLRPDYKEYLMDAINYGLTKYETSFGDFKGTFKLYENYTKDFNVINQLLSVQDENKSVKEELEKIKKQIKN